MNSDAAKANEKPTLLFFRYRNGDALVPFMQLNRDLHLKCLLLSFEVVVIDSDTDFSEECDRHGADIALFEMLSGAESVACERPQISNTHVENGVEKLAFFNADSWCENRTGFYHDMELWGIENAFSICVTSQERSPELAGRLFVWPNFIDPDIFHDYGQSKLIPILLTGANYPLYPWRQEVFPRLQEAYPSMLCPHFGYAGTTRSVHMLMGKRYAQTINAARFTPTCGSVAKELVRKHLEVPASMSCLVTERTPAVESAGFIDMKNCVFTDGESVVDKIDYLTKDPALLDEITRAGHQLVHTKHTIGHRDQVFQWFQLNRALQPGQAIVQPTPFAPLSVVGPGEQVCAPLKCEGRDLAVIAEGDRRLLEGRPRDAERLYLIAQGQISWMPEARLRVAVAQLHARRADTAICWLKDLLEHSLVAYGASEPDPVEWSWYLVALLCLGRVDEARAGASLFTALRHPQLDRIRCLVAPLDQSGSDQDLQPAATRYRPTIHHLPWQTSADELSDLRQLLRAYGRSGLVDRGWDTAATDALPDRRVDPEVAVARGQRRPADPSNRLEALALIQSVQRKEQRRPRNIGRYLARRSRRVLTRIPGRRQLIRLLAE